MHLKVTERYKIYYYNAKIQEVKVIDFKFDLYSRYLRDGVIVTFIFFYETFNINIIMKNNSISISILY